MSFDRHQLKKLATPLDETRIQRREQDGKTLAYLEGWFVIQEANRIFGYDGWDRQMVQSERVFTTKDGREVACGYMARVRVSVRMQTGMVVREGTGFGQATASHPGDAHERALKGAETDATKRALVTFGGRFGLLLHDKGVHPVMPAVEPAPSASVGAAPSADRGAHGAIAASANDGSPTQGSIHWLVQADGIAFKVGSAESFCTGLRQLIEAAASGVEVERLSHNNEAGLERLRSLAHLTTARGAHYADVLEGLIAAKIKDFAAPQTGKTETGRSEADKPETDRLEADQPGIEKIAPEEIADGPAQPVHDPAVIPVPLPRTERSYVPVPPYPLARVIERMSERMSERPALAGGIAAKPATPHDTVTANQTNTRDAHAQPTALDQNVAALSKTDRTPTVPTRRSLISGGFSIDKSVLAIPSERRLRSKAHLGLVAARPCLICEALPCHAHHITFAQPRGLSQKVSDEYTVPLCALHHNELHAFGNEASWWRNQGIEPLPKANALWLESAGVQMPESQTVPDGAAALALPVPDKAS